MWITWLVMLRQTPETSIGNINSQKKDTQGIPPLKRKNGKGVAQSDLEKAEEFNSQFTDVFNKDEHTQVPLLDRSAPFMNDIAVSNEGVIKLLKGLNPSKALGPDELHPSPKRASNRVRSGICSSFSAINWHWWNPKGMVSCKYLPPFQEEWQVTCAQLSPGFLDLCTLQVIRTHSVFKYNGSSWWI